MKKIAIISGIVLILTACSNSENNNYSSLPSNDYTVTRNFDSIASKVKVSGVSTRISGDALIYVTGTLENTSNTSIDDILELAIYNSNNEVIKTKHIIAKIPSGGTQAFDELVGLIDEVGKDVASVTIQD